MIMPETREERRERFKKLTTEINESFNGTYSVALSQLTGLSKEEINSITTNTEGSRTYSLLIKVVEEASRKNFTQAELVEDIKELGEVAVKIAKKIPSLASLF
jgi:tRNA U54 and U55 pseudouridine synthase Pus10|tara:strand:+ start:361 stop:669 length:309 start_codon:yes stop_codon:yes gene_type:complete